MIDLSNSAHLIITVTKFITEQKSFLTYPVWTQELGDITPHVISYQKVYQLVYVFSEEKHCHETLSLLVAM